jgi:methanogenic corrinoid protein MtbC1
METSGFRVIDLGENVPASWFVEAAIKYEARIVGISSLLTTGDPFVEETIQAVRNSNVGDKVKIICGGTALTRKFIEETSGADAYARDTAEGVRKIKQMLKIGD